MKEALVLLTQEFVDRLHNHFSQLLNEQEEQDEKVDLSNLIDAVAEDDFFQDHMNEIVRESLDGERESLETLLYRLMNDFKKPSISWLQFLGHFSKRGRLQGYNDIDVSPSREKVQFLTMAEQGLAQAAEAGKETDEDKVQRVQTKLKDRLDYKEEMIPKDGKGKYNITVPVVFEFLNRTKEHKTIREQKVEEMIKEKHDRVEEERGYRFKANDIPKSTKQPKYQQILAANEERRQEVKRMSLAITKQREKPFGFYLRDQERAKHQRPQSDMKPVYEPFKASIIPWRVRAPLYQEMVERAEYAREQRVKRNAEASLSLAKLPPRMQEHEDRKRQAEEEGAVSEQRQSQSLDRLFTFMPPKAKPVPDFKRLQKQFQQSLEELKRLKNQSATVPEPFHFHNPKSTASMRRHLDGENQLINPTLKKLAKSVGRRAASPQERDDRENPANTAKFSAYVDQRRRKQEGKKNAEEQKYQDDMDRYMKQNRLAQRVKCSPALVSTANELKKRKQRSQKQAREKVARLQRAWENQLEAINFNVANKPLLVEQVSKAFMRNLAQIRELQKYVNILREANLDPDAHLTEE